MFCTSCGSQVSDGAQFCTKCGVAMGATGGSVAVATMPGTPAPAIDKFARLSPYWQEVFRKFSERPKEMQVKWNWPAFFFGFIWYLVKGMPLKALLIIGVAVITFGAGGVFLAVYAGLYGPWDYYLKEAYGKQLW